MAALGLHLGGAALAIGHLKAGDDEGGLGANATEFAIEMESPKVENDDLPPGPLVEEQQALRHQDEQKAEKEANLPQAKPTVDDDADFRVSRDNTKEKEDEPKTAAVRAINAPDQDAMQATAPPTLDEKARESDKAKAPSRGIGKDVRKLTADWGRKISAYFELHKRYPKDRDKSNGATVKVSLVLNRRGNVVSAIVVESSGDEAFDAAALSMIHRSDPVPLPPAGLTDDQFSFNLPVLFQKPRK